MWIEKKIITGPDTCTITNKGAKAQTWVGPDTK